MRLPPGRTGGHAGRPEPASLADALAHHRAGRVAAAERLYLELLAAQPGHPEALHHLGLLRAQGGRAGEAAELIRRAIDGDPGAALPHYNLGIVLQELGRIEEAIGSYRSALALDPLAASAWVNLGNALAAQGDDAAAEDAYGQALSLQPGFAHAHLNLGVLRRRQGRLGEAIAQLRRAVEIRPGSAEALTLLGAVLIDLGDAAAARDVLLRARRLAPASAEAHGNLGVAWVELGELAAAEPHLRRAVALAPASADVHLGLGRLLQERRRPQEALACFDRALELRPDFAEALASRAGVLQVLGRFAEAGAAAERAFALQPRNGRIGYGLAQARRLAAGDERIARLEELWRHLPQDAPDRIPLCFALGKVYDETGRRDEAFSAWLEGNRLKRGRVRFDLAELCAFAGRLRSTFGPAEMPPAATGDPSDLPILIVGMPRSGTTLVEQILASHPQVHGAGELEALAEVAVSLPGGYPQGVAALAAPALRRAGDAYVSRLRALAPRAGRVCDKAPQNFFHLGLLARILPRARVIHCTRHPLDVCLSCFSILFFRDAQPFTYDLAELGGYYLLYDELMRHWRSVLPQSMHEVRYEDLVADQEAVSRRLLEFCGLPWDEGCLEFHRTERPVQTASRLQVRQPLYASAVGRWRRYEGQLAPLRQILAPVL